MLTQLLLVLGVMVLFAAAVGVRVLLIKDGAVRGTCASQTPALNKEGIACGLCGRMPGEACGEEKEA